MRFLRVISFAGSFAAGIVLTEVSTWAASRDDVAVNARVFQGYARTRLADGTFKPERYTFGDGGRWKGGSVDPSVEALPFKQIAETIAGPLRAQAYLPATDSWPADLLILVFWGVTSGAAGGEFNHATQTVSDAFRDVGNKDALDSALMLNQLENRARDRNNVSNARILGYMEDYMRARELQEVGNFSFARDRVQELEANRYFVVLKAYDFAVAKKEKKLSLLWEARFSIDAGSNRFDAQLPTMVQSAAKYFGQDTGGLLRRELPEGKVEIGTPKVVEPAPAPNPPGKR